MQELPAIETSDLLRKSVLSTMVLAEDTDSYWSNPIEEQKARCEVP